MAPGKENFIPEICELKHSTINKDISEIQEDIEEIKKEDNGRHEEIKDLIENLSNDIKLSHQNLKNKIVLVNKSMGDKIDDLNDFDKQLRGNGDPGIWESVRNIKNNVKILLVIMALIVICMVGGDYRGVSINKIRSFFGISEQEAKQIEVKLPAKIEIPKKIKKPLKTK